MGTTVWVDDQTRNELRRLQERLGTGSVNATIARLIRQPAADARSLFAAHRQAIRTILGRHGVRRLVAYGSRARGDARPTSDFDVAVEIEPEADPLAVLAVEADLEEELEIPVSAVELPNPRLEPVIEKEGVEFGG